MLAKPCSVAKAHSNTAPLQSFLISPFFSVSLLSAAAALTCSCSPIYPSMAKDSQPPPLPFLEASDERGWMDSTALLLKKINWASESGYWLMSGSVQWGSLSHSAFFTPLAPSCFDLSLWVWCHSVHLSVMPSVLFASFSRLGANRIYKGLSNGWPRFQTIYIHMQVKIPFLSMMLLEMHSNPLFGH